MIKSYDIFDTLIARWYKEPDSIFNELQKKINIDNFVELRKRSEIISGDSIDNIYNTFSHISGLSIEECEKIKNLEIELEILMSIPINKMINKVSDEDILISDMYLGEKNIKKILEKNGFKKKSKLFVTPNGKSSGFIWDNLKKNYSIECHYGDNIHSDVVSPKNNGINAELFNLSNFSDIENSVYKYNNSLSLLMRCLRLINPYDDFSNEDIFWSEAVNYTVTINILAAFELKKFISNKNYKNILFTTRDCMHLYKIFTSLFPEYKNSSHIFHTSRTMYNNPSEDFIKYASSMMENSLIIDLHASGNSFLKFCNINNIKNSELFLIIEFGEKNKVKHGLFNLNLFNLSDKIEKINYATVGHMINYKQGLDIREELEYDIKIVKIYEDVINLACNFIDKGFIINNQNSDKLLLAFLKKLERDIKITNFIKHKDNLLEN